MRDGDIDYSEYSLAELEEALDAIDEHQYPRNHANLLLAYEKLRANIQETNLPETSVSNGAAAPVSYWVMFWDSRPVHAALGIFCFWWAYDIFTQPDACPPEGRLMGYIINAMCENFGYAVAAGIPLIMGLILVAIAVAPRRRSGP